MRARVVASGAARGPVLASAEGLSFWGGVDPATGRVIDAQHPWHGASVTGAVLAMPTSRGSCTGSGVLLDLVLGGRAPALLAFREDEDVLTLGALVAAHLFGRRLPVLRLDAEAWARLAGGREAAFDGDSLTVDGAAIPVEPEAAGALELSARDRALLGGEGGEAARAAMEAVVAMARAQGARRLIDVTRAHIDGCIYASPANLVFAERMRDMGARVAVPTTMNAISVDLENWRAQGTPPDLGRPAAALAEAYVAMGARPTFTCSPYQLEGPPGAGEALGWSESNAVIYANSVLGARSPKHPDFLDLFIAVTGRAPEAGVYLDAPRRARRVLRVAAPGGIDDAFWPLLGHLAGRLAPDRIPLIAGLEGVAASEDDLQALCAAFGTTSGAPMVHVAGHTPEAGGPLAEGADEREVTVADLRDDWDALDGGAGEVDLVALGSPHVSLAGLRRLDGLAADTGPARVPVVVTCGRGVRESARAEGVLGRLEAWGARVVSDLCWCSISEPVLPPGARAVVTNSGKYAHYGPGLHGRTTRLASLADCVRAAVTGEAPGRPEWLA